MTGRTRERNQARLVRCSANCGALVWLAGALPVADDAEFVCPTCSAGDACPDDPDGLHHIGCGCEQAEAS